MTSPQRLATALSALAATALLIAGCTATPGSATPTSTATTQPSSSPDDDFGDIEGTLLDGGRMFAVVTWGSSTCVPAVDTVTAEGQTVTVTLVDTDADAVCTKDMAPRASAGMLPEGVDPTQDITLNVTYGDVVDDVDLDGDPALAGAAGTPTDYQPSAGWVGDGGLVLLTWGSSGCPPVIESVQGAGNAGTVTFSTDPDQICTMDMAPRATLISFGDDAVEEDGFTLTLVGDNLDGTVAVMGD
ncbi:hypothetical protein [Microbacterium aurantiacum]|uniref:hypothetical protein n=1 Tax=Microbacterium aurantiacum TaxID=162393 RepID=UPI000C7FC075|nr:hypothetical protein [Microbacterium aurantiacum]